MEEGGAVEYQKSAVSYQEFSFCHRISQSQSILYFWDVCKAELLDHPDHRKIKQETNGQLYILHRCSKQMALIQAEIYFQASYSSLIHMM